VQSRVEHDKFLALTVSFVRFIASAVRHAIPFSPAPHGVSTDSLDAAHIASTGHDARSRSDFSPYPSPHPRR
jgi:hypothetical protein